MYAFDAAIAGLVDETIRDIGNFDLVFDASAAPPGAPSPYLQAHRHEFIRTVQDLSAHFAGGQGRRVLEIGAFFGVVSVSLARRGFQVTAADIPEYIGMSAQQARFRSLGVATAGIRLEDFALPFEDDAFDAVLMCEVLEHLNFNPLPLLKEINRIIVPGGLFYLSLPNQASLYNRLALLRGRSIQVSVESFFEQLSSDVIVNGHWREYTAEDIRTMLTRLGFRMVRHYYFSYGECLPVNSLRRVLARALFELLPQLKENQTALAVKHERSRLAFSIPATVHPTRRSI